MHKSDTGAASPNQAERTGRDFLDSVEARFGRITCDLAAENASVAVASKFIGPEEDSLKVPWPTKGVLWLNPPFKRILPWAQKCAEWTRTAQPGSRLLFLVPSSVDAVWWNKHVRGTARTLSLRPRLTFRGHTNPFPKPMSLNVYDPAWPQNLPTVEDWGWKRELAVGQHCLLRGQGDKPWVIREALGALHDEEAGFVRGSDCFVVQAEDQIFTVEAADIVHILNVDFSLDAPDFDDETDPGVVIVTEGS